MPVKSPLYDRDFFAWSRQQADLLRAGKLAEADIEHIAEEIESPGRTEKRELISRLTVLLLHLLKWRYQPDKRRPRWEAGIRVQRNRLADHLDDNPSLKPLLPQALTAAHRDAALEAVAETGLAGATFPDACPWTAEQVLDGGFWPGISAVAGITLGKGRSNVTINPSTNWFCERQPRGFISPVAQHPALVAQLPVVLLRLLLLRLVRLPLLRLVRLPLVRRHFHPRWTRQLRSTLSEDRRIALTNHLAHRLPC